MEKWRKRRRIWGFWEPRPERWEGLHSRSLSLSHTHSHTHTSAHKYTHARSIFYSTSDYLFSFLHHTLSLSFSLSHPLTPTHTRSRGTADSVLLSLLSECGLERNRTRTDTRPEKLPPLPPSLTPSLHPPPLPLLLISAEAVGTNWRQNLKPSMTWLISGLNSNGVTDTAATATTVKTTTLSRDFLSALIQHKCRWDPCG